MGSKERRVREKAATRQTILDAARDVFVAEGYDGLSLRKVAERAEYSATAIYVHFADKDALLTELSICDFHDFTARFAAVPLDGSPPERLLALGRTYVKFGLEFPAQYRHLFMTQRTVSPEAMAAKPEVDAYDILKAAVVAVMETGELHPSWDDADQVAQLLWAGLHGVVALSLTKAGHVELLPVEAQAEVMCRLLLDALRLARP